MDEQSLDDLYPTITLYPKRWTAIGGIVFSALAIAAGIWMGGSGYLEVLTVGFFGLCLIVFVIQLIPGSSFLRVDELGFTFSSGFRPTTIPWSDVDEFYVIQIRTSGIKTNSMVGFNFNPASDQAKIGRRIAKFISQCEGALPDTYGMKAEALCELMNRYLGHAKGVQGAAEGMGGIV